MSSTLEIEDRPVDSTRTAAILTEHGYPTAPATLNKLRCVGGGPEYIKYSRSVMYVPSKALAWAAARAQVRRNTSDQPSVIETPNAAGIRPETDRKVDDTQVMRDRASRNR